MLLFSKKLKFFINWCRMKNSAYKFCIPSPLQIGITFIGVINQTGLVGQHPIQRDLLTFKNNSTFARVNNITKLNSLAPEFKWFISNKHLQVIFSTKRNIICKSSLQKHSLFFFFFNKDIAQITCEAILLLIKYPDFFPKKKIKKVFKFSSSHTKPTSAQPFKPG